MCIIIFILLEELNSMAQVKQKNKKRIKNESVLDVKFTVLLRVNSGAFPLFFVSK